MVKFHISYVLEAKTIPSEDSKIFMSLIMQIFLQLLKEESQGKLFHLSGIEWKYIYRVYTPKPGYSLNRTQDLIVFFLF